MYLNETFMWNIFKFGHRKPLKMIKFFTTSTPTKSDEVIRLIAIGKGSSIVRAIEDEKSKSAESSTAGTGVSGGVTVKRIGSIEAK